MGLTFKPGACIDIMFHVTGNDPVKVTWVFLQGTCLSNVVAACHEVCYRFERKTGLPCTYEIIGEVENLN